MQSQRLIESLVGVFLVLAIIAMSLLAFKVSGLTSLIPADTFTVTANFDDIGSLKVRAPIKMSGVQIGEVSKITLDANTFKAVVQMQINKQYNNIPDDSSVSILTSGLLGDNYIELAPMYSSTYLKNGSQIEYTQSAMILEKLIGRLIYKLGNNNNDDGDKNAKQKD